MKDDAGKIPWGKKWAWNKSIRTQENTTRWKRISLIWFLMLLPRKKMMKIYCRDKKQCWSAQNRTHKWTKQKNAAIYCKEDKVFDIYILMISLWFCGARVNSRVHMDTCWLKYSFNMDNTRVSPGTEAGRRDSPWVLEPCCSGAGWSLLGFGVSRAGHTDPTM